MLNTIDDLICLVMHSIIWKKIDVRMDWVAHTYQISESFLPKHYSICSWMDVWPDNMGELLQVSGNYQMYNRTRYNLWKNIKR